MPTRLRAPRLFALLVVVASLGACGEEEVTPDPVAVLRYGAMDPEEERRLFGEGGAVDLGEVAALRAPPRPERRQPTRRRRGPAPGAAVAYTVDPAKAENGGTIRGVVRFSGTPKVLTIEVDKDTAQCGHEEHASERAVFDEVELTVANCVVYLQDVSAGKDWTGDMAADDRSSVLDQNGCVYDPHVMVVRPETQIAIKNSDPVLHNVHAYRNNLLIEQFNVGSPPQSLDRTNPGAYLEKAAKYIVKCDIHAWMNAYIHALPNPYYAVTAKDGAFTIEDVPPGEWTLVCWHEGIKEMPQFSNDGAISSYTYGDDYNEQAKVEVGSGETVEVDFTLRVEGE